MCLKEQVPLEILPNGEYAKKKGLLEELELMGNHVAQQNHSENELAGYLSQHKFKKTFKTYFKKNKIEGTSAWLEEQIRKKKGVDEEEEEIKWLEAEEKRTERHMIRAISTPKAKVPKLKLPPGI